MTPQHKKIMNHLTEGKHLTIVEAMHVYRIYNLKARIEELRRMGNDILTVMCHDETGKRYARYQLNKEAA